jgi:hypothetical protein
MRISTGYQPATGAVKEPAVGVEWLLLSSRMMVGVAPSQMRI